jgi:hypothetical protein
LLTIEIHCRRPAKKFCNERRRSGRRSERCGGRCRHPSPTTQETGDDSMPFRPGQSGNPAGRQLGSRNKSTLLARQILDDRAGALTTAALDRAQEGDAVALRVCMDRVTPPLREQPFNFDMPALVAPPDALIATNAIAQAVAHDELPAPAAAVLMKIVRDFVVVARLIGQLEAETHGAAARIAVDDVRYIDWTRDDDAAAAGDTRADAAGARP